MGCSLLLDSRTERRGEEIITQEAGETINILINILFIGGKLTVLNDCSLSSGRGKGSIRSLKDCLTLLTSFISLFVGFLSSLSYFLSLCLALHISCLDVAFHPAVGLESCFVRNMVQREKKKLK